MKVAVIYNQESMKVINLIGALNPEKYRVEAIQRITKALKASGHQVKTLEGDKHLIENLEEFMPAVVKGERPGMALNLAYGIQGHARYTQVPGILEMIGIPYVGSGPLAHSLSLDKVVAKILFKQNGLPTPDFAVLETPDFPTPDLNYPLIVKPKSGADSFGLTVVHNEKELREAAAYIFNEYAEPVLAECYIEGREINIGMIGNPPEAFPPVELDFGDGPHVYTNDDKGGRSGRTVNYICPAELDEETTKKAQEIACKAFTTLQCNDCARVDMRIGEDGSLYLLELNSLPSLGYRGSFVVGAQHAGLDFRALLNRLLDSAIQRYFGTATVAPPASIEKNVSDNTFSYLTANRDKLEQRIGELITYSSRMSDPIATRELVKHLELRYQELGLKPVKEFSDEHVVSTWETDAGVKDGILIIIQIDSMLEAEIPYQAYRRSPEWIHGESVGISRAPLAMIEFAIRALKRQNQLRKKRLGILIYSDEGRDCRYSREKIEQASRLASKVIVLGQGSAGGNIVVGSRGIRKYQLIVEDKPRDLRPGTKTYDALRWTNIKTEAIMQLSSQKDRLGIFVNGISMKHFPLMLPHCVQVSLLASYYKSQTANKAEEDIRSLLGKKGPKWRLNLVSDRPGMLLRRENRSFFGEILEIANELEIPISHSTSAIPSVAGLVPRGVGAIFGLGPLVDAPHTPHEAVQRVSLFQRTILLTEFLRRS
jgi:D-alanine-D-alanine ligase